MRRRDIVANLERKVFRVFGVIKARAHHHTRSRTPCVGIIFLFQYNDTHLSHSTHKHGKEGEKDCLLTKRGYIIGNNKRLCFQKMRQKKTYLLAKMLRNCSVRYTERTSFHSQSRYKQIAMGFCPPIQNIK